MKASLFVRTLSEVEDYRLKRCLRTKDSFALRRAHLILGSARGVSVPLLSQQTGYTVQMVRHVIHAFNEQGLACLVRQSNRPTTAASVLSEDACQQLQHFLHQSPRLWQKKSRIRAACGVWLCWPKSPMNRVSRHIRSVTKRCVGLCCV